MWRLQSGQAEYAVLARPVYAKRREEIMQRLTQGVREMFAESTAKQRWQAGCIQT